MMIDHTALPNVFTDPQTLLQQNGFCNLETNLSLRDAKLYLELIILEYWLSLYVTSRCHRYSVLDKASVRDTFSKRHSYGHPNQRLELKEFGDEYLEKYIILADCFFKKIHRMVHSVII